MTTPPPSSKPALPRHQWQMLPIGRICTVCRVVQASDEFDDSGGCGYENVPSAATGTPEVVSEKRARTHTARLLRILDEELQQQRVEPEYLEERIQMRKKHARLVDDYVANIREAL